MLSGHSDGPSRPALLVIVGSLLLACSSSSDGDRMDGGTGGTLATGGSSTIGGSLAGTGGARTGGTPGSGGTLGGGGAIESGGATATGGTSVGSLAGSGGTSSTGGATGAAGRDGDEGGAVGGSTGGTGKGDTGGTSTGGSAGSATSGSGGAHSGGSSASGGSAGSGGKTGSGGGTASSLCPSGITQTITVAKDGSGQFSTVQAAVNSIPSGSTTPIRIDIKAGTYTEKLTIASRTNLCLVGASATSTILTYGDSNAAVGSTSASASVHISANDFSAANLTIANSFGTGSQAVALRATGQRQQFLGCRFIGNQDTLYTHNGSQYFRNCYVEGTVDFVFGGATAVLQNCEIRNVGFGSATTAPNTTIGTAYGIVFLGGKFTATSNVQAGSVALARPWGADGFAAFLNAELGGHISAAGFTTMSGNDPRNARFHEYGSKGAGANASSRSSYQLNATQAASYTLATIFGSWTPSYSQ